ncbi:MAG: DivIVA domain-containing protein [Erysipelotrichaceae bacterium]|nr:DivIVA domain-containing protein [Erysipelotrichaceae bacterium]MBR5049244.1 DivIVA domain-containing protein [Erysipelotrichaceae bacterium]
MNGNHRFNLVTSGYDCYQVDNEIDRYEYHVRELNEKILLYQNQIETLNNQFNMIKKRYQLLVSELQAREKQADDVGRLALLEANNIITDAQKSADDIIDEAMLKVQSYVDTMKKFSEQNQEKTRLLRQSITDLLDTIDSYSDLSVPNPFEAETPAENTEEN